MVLIESFVASVYKDLTVLIYSSQLLNFQTLVFRSWTFDTVALLNVFIIPLFYLYYTYICIRIFISLLVYL